MYLLNFGVAIISVLVGLYVYKIWDESFDRNNNILKFLWIMQFTLALINVVAGTYLMVVE
jgi:hypothetical protein